MGSRPGCDRARVSHGQQHHLGHISATAAASPLRADFGEQDSPPGPREHTPAVCPLRPQPPIAMPSEPPAKLASWHEPRSPSCVSRMFPGHSRQWLERPPVTATLTDPLRLGSASGLGDGGRGAVGFPARAPRRERVCDPRDSSGPLCSREPAPHAPERGPRARINAFCL